MKKYAIIVAGGSGLRMGTATPKQFLLIHEKPILWYTLHTFLKSYKDIHIILVLPADYYDTGRAICDEIVSQSSDSDRRWRRNTFSFCPKRPFSC